MKKLYFAAFGILLTSNYALASLNGTLKCEVNIQGVDANGVAVNKTAYAAEATGDLGGILRVQKSILEANNGYAAMLQNGMLSIDVGTYASCPNGRCMEFHAQVSTRTAVVLDMPVTLKFAGGTIRSTHAALLPYTVSCTVIKK